MTNQNNNDNQLYNTLHDATDNLNGMDDTMDKILMEEQLMNDILSAQNEAKILSGKEVAAAIMDDNLKHTQQLQHQGCQPALTVFRIGERPDDIYYENSIKRHCKEVGIHCQVVALQTNIKEEEFAAMLMQAAQDASVHGIFFFSPLPPSLDENRLRMLIPAAKDVDCLSRKAQAAIYCGNSPGQQSFPPCTPQAVMAILKYYQIPIAGKQVVVLGRSMVVGKPLAMLLLNENATVTIAHSKSDNLSQICWQADIVVAAAGKPRLVQGSWLRPGQTVIDVGMNADPENGGKMCGDVDFAAAKEMVGAITPVPGGVGLITTALLCRHVITAAERQVNHA